MHKDKFFLMLLLACMVGCANEYQPPVESIPDIPPGRGAARAEGESAFSTGATSGKKETGPANALARPK